jgi:hypothetical protein
MLYIASQEMREYLEENIKQCIFNGMKSNGLQNRAFKFKLLSPHPPKKIVLF